MSSVWLVYTPPLWRWSAKKLCKFQQLTRPAGRRVFFFFPLSHFPAMFWTAFLQTSHSPWGIVSAWWDWMIVLIHKGMESDSNQGTQRKLRSQVQQWAQLKCGELCSLSDFLAPPRGVFFCVWLPWNGTSLTALWCRYCTSRSFLFPFSLTWALLDGRKPLILVLWKCRKDAIKWLFLSIGYPCDQMKSRFKIQFLPWQCKAENKLSLPNSLVME